ncbi:MAG: DNA polymerase III subunit delta [Lachnospiraceae bacterium]|nr:DNA polymerase III subunit delta [Lachnospiraceae bacterium]MDE6251527.1 DNA polymerase III subunit delta [Lachnospiraceae bacterium]
MAGYKDILGNEQIKEHFKNAIKLHKVSHAYILNGDKGMGKKMLSNVFAMALQCERGTEEPCMECRSCKQVISGNHPDIKYITHEKPNVIAVDEVREQINNDIQIKPYSSRYKIYIVDEAEKMNLQAQNALLKTIEEPPEYGIIILLTSNSEMFLPTILSRCVMLNMKLMEKGQMRDYLMKKMGLPDYHADVIIAFSGGNLGKAIRLASSEDFNELKSSVTHLLEYIGDMETYEVVMAVKQVEKYKVDIADYIDLMMVWYRDVLMFKASRDMNELTFKDEYGYIKEQAEKISFNGIEEILKAMEKAKVRIRANVNFDLAIEMMYLTIRDGLYGR